MSRWRAGLVNKTQHVQADCQVAMKSPHPLCLVPLPSLTEPQGATRPAVQGSQGKRMSHWWGGKTGEGLHRIQKLPTRCPPPCSTYLSCCGCCGCCVLLLLSLPEVDGKVG
jgi:hypothetical protein